MALTSCLTAANEPRRMARRVMMPKKISTWLSQELEVGAKMEMEATMTCQPRTHPGVLVGGSAQSASSHPR